MKMKTIVELQAIEHHISESENDDDCIITGPAFYFYVVGGAEAYNEVKHGRMGTGCY
jgi:hypothetical protein